MLKKYWVTKTNDEYSVISDSFDAVGGFSYALLKGGFATESEAQAHADTANAEDLGYAENDSLYYHDPSERMNELGYVYADGKWTWSRELMVKSAR